jgi:hypothetical protein
MASHAGRQIKSQKAFLKITHHSNFAFFSKLELSAEVIEKSNVLDFDLQAYSMDAAEEQTRAKRIVRIGAIQNKIVLPTDAPVIKQVRT